MSDKAKFGYLAGILDGEGCLSITAGQKETCVNYNSTLQVQNTSKELIDWLQHKFGGSVYLSKKETDKTKEAYMWRVLKKKDIEILLLATLPYLVVKREQAKLLLEFVRLSREAAPSQRKALYEKLRKLNSRGVSLTTNTQETSPEVMIESELHGDMQSDLMVTSGTSES
jgi:hypothetical protein